MKKIIILCLLTILNGAIKAQPGTLDLTFGADGKVLSETYSGEANAVAIQPDGKIVVGGSGGWYDNDSNLVSGFLVVRYNADGSLDESFGDKGRAINDLGEPAPFTKTIYAIAIQSDGKIVAAGQYGASGDDSRIAVLRFNADGSIDTQFGEGGLAITSLSGYYDIVRDMALLPDGRIVVTGDTQAGINDNRRSFINCYTVAGVLDKNFGINGVTIVTFSENADINSIAVTKTGKIIIAGNYTVYDKHVLLKYNSDGSIDYSFGKDGLVVFGFDDDIYSQSLSDIVLSADNKIITVGTAYTNSNNPYAGILTVRFLENGAPDSSFGTNGYSIINQTKRNMRGYAVEVNKTGNIIIAGGYNDSKVGSPFITGLKDNGTVDSTFGTNGFTYTEFVGLGDILNAIALQEDGKIVVTGYSLYQNFPDYRYYVILGRYEGYGIEKDKYVKIKKWLHRHGFTWDDFPGKNISYYAVQRSSNGNTFNEIARLFNRNNQQQYSYEDAAPLAGNNYYRLAAVSSDGSTAYSNIIAIDNNAIKLYPNPVRNTLQVEGLPATEKTKLTITDFSGNTRMSVQVTGKNYSWNISRMDPGNYILKMESKGITVTKKFVKE
jgi:uncharacterized delta-60 repeat protein